MSEIRREVSSYEMSMWAMVDKLHPFGDVRADLRSGLAANAIRGSQGSPLIDLDKYILEGKTDAQREEDAKLNDVNEDDVAALFGFNFGDG